MSKSQSKYFEFIKEPNDHEFLLSEFKGWNGLIVMELNLPKNLNVKSGSIKSKYFDIKEKEKIFVLTKGKAKIYLDDNSYTLKEFDALNLYSKNSNYEIKSEEDSKIFIVSAENLKPFTKNPVFFNFKKDITSHDIWGGKCISRVFFGESLNLVLFDLKKGFNFHDNGHKNEQITWVTNGNLDFYVNNLKKNLSPGKGVDIGSFDKHGGVSNGAIGFDAFYPKREEKKYK